MSLPPGFNSSAGRAALRELLGPRNFLGALSAMQRELGYAFRLRLPGFSPAVLSGPQAAHAVLVDARSSLRWRNDADPVAGLLRHGLLVEDGTAHDDLRRRIMPSLHRQQVASYIRAMWARTDQVLTAWRTGETYDMLVEMRRIALLVLMETLFAVDMTPDLERLFPSVLEMLKTISPGLWLLGAPRRRAEAAVGEVDVYLRSLIRARRAAPSTGGDLLSGLIDSGMDDDLIRDQMLTLFIAGHDTSTALLAWTLYLVGRTPAVLPRLVAEAAALPHDRPPSAGQVESLVYLDQVISETLRLYPPIHVGNRLAARELSVCVYDLPAGHRVMVSIYATHHDEAHWPDPERFDPGRFVPGEKHHPYSFLPFGGGPRNCIGSSFARVEARVILARIFQRFDLSLVRRRVRLHMGATLEPRPGVFMRVMPR